MRRSMENYHERAVYWYNETKDSLVVFHGDVTTIYCQPGASMHGGHWGEQTKTLAVRYDASGKSYGTTTGCEKTFTCRSEMVCASHERVAGQRLANVEWTMSMRIKRSSSLSCGASGRGGVLGIELISDTIGKLNTIYVATSDDNLIPLYVLTQAYWTVVLDLGDWGL